MAERDFTTEHHTREKEIKDALGRIKRVGGTLENICQIRALSCEDTPETELISFTYQQITEFAATLEVAAETLTHHFKKQAATNVANQTSTPQNHEEIPKKSPQDINQGDKLNNAISEIRALAVGLFDGDTEEWNAGESKTLASMIFERAALCEKLLEIDRQ